MQWIAKLCVNRPVLAAVIILTICVVGFVGYGQLSLDRFPKVDFPMVTVTTVRPGAAPEEVETDISDPIEQAVNTIEGIEELRSVSSEGVSRVMIQFRLDKDIDIAAQEVRDRVNSALGDLPDDIEMPTISKVDGDATPVMLVVVEAERPLRELTELADRTVRRALESANGVGQVRVLGGARRQLNVWVDPLRLRAQGLTVPEVERAIAAQNLTMPGGPVETGPEQVTLRVRGRVEHASDLARIVLRATGEHPIRLGDVARVEDGVEDPDTVAIQDGDRAVVLSIRKQSGTSTVEVVDSVTARIAELGPRLPRGVTLRVVSDNSTIIRNSVHSVEEHLVLGAIFAAIAVLLFLGNVRSTVIAAIAIPVSIIGTFAFLAVKGLALDTITLLALALAVGIVIDDAIVVLENIVRFVEEKKMHPREAAIAATKEIGLAVMATAPMVPSECLLRRARAIASDVRAEDRRYADLLASLDAYDPAALWPTIAGGGRAAPAAALLALAFANERVPRVDDQEGGGFADLIAGYDEQARPVGDGALGVLASSREAAEVIDAFGRIGHMLDVVERGSPAMREAGEALERSLETAVVPVAPPIALTGSLEATIPGARNAACSEGLLGRPIVTIDRNLHVAVLSSPAIGFERRHARLLGTPLPGYPLGPASTLADADLRDALDRAAGDLPYAGGNDAELPREPSDDRELEDAKESDDDKEMPAGGAQSFGPRARVVLVVDASVPMSTVRKVVAQLELAVPTRLLHRFGGRGIAPCALAADQGEASCLPLPPASELPTHGDASQLGDACNML